MELRPLRIAIALSAAGLLYAPGARADIGWTNRLEAASRQTLGTLACRWIANELPVRLVNAAGDPPLELLLTPRRTTLRQPGARRDARLPGAFESYAFTPPASNCVTLAWRRRSDSWMLFVNDQPAARFPEVWTNTVRLQTPVDRLPPGDAPADYLQRLGSFRFEDTFLVPEGTANALQNWEVLAGAWRMHTVTGTLSGAITHGRMTRFPTPARSPNFYSLDGRGGAAAILTGEAFCDRYAFRAAVQHNSGTNGLVFLAGDDHRGYGFTARTDPTSGRLCFDLWHGVLGRLDAPRDVLQTVATDLLPGQWLQLEVRLFDDRLVCLADQVPILRQRLRLPPGGRFGLFSDTADGTRFDDVLAASHEDLPLESEADVDFNTRVRPDQLRVIGEPLSGVVLPPDLPFEAGQHLSLAAQATPQSWIVGSTADRGHRLDAVFVPDRATFACGLLAGWTAPDQPVYRLSCTQDAQSLRVQLVRTSPGRTEVLDEHVLPARRTRQLQLTLDATRDGELTATLDGRLVLVHRLAEPLVGAGGLWCGPQTRLRCLLPLYRTDVPVFRDRFEKNLNYVNDPFMRNWASPEGQWLTTPDGRSWFRSDVLGRVDLRLPAIAPSTLDLAIPEHQTNGTYAVAVSNEWLWVFAPSGSVARAVAARIPLAALPEQVLEGDKGSMRFYGVHLADYALWIDCDTGLLARCHLAAPPPGRRMMLQGLTVDQLRYARVERERVLDCLFTESLQNWTLNGGQWEVINRFQCEPTWSHMNGENGTSLAALWSKYEVGGDFTMELYAGTRHGWYERPGDYNLTVLSPRGTTGDGYSITCTGWDPDASQLVTRLLRNGKPLAQSSQYLAPRVRENSRRLASEPLVGPGRDVHGAWYSMQLRRVGDRLGYSFDNQPVFDCVDPEPLASGVFGIWTYMNSMMVARVRITAQTIRPRRFAFHRVAAAAAPPPPAASGGSTNVTVNGLPVELLAPDWWQADDPVSHPDLRFELAPDGHPEMRVEACLGGGSFLTRALLPPISADHLLGWRFEIARHPEARVNFEFTIGEPTDKGFEPRVHYSHVLSGSDEIRGPRLLAGRCTPPPASTPAGARTPVWTSVQVWLPTGQLRETTHVRLDGFGNLQPSDVQQGLLGNPPGAWYAIRGLRPIWHGAPRLSGPAGLQAAFAEVDRQVSQSRVGRVNALVLPAVIDPRRPLLEWGLPPPASVGITAWLTATPPDAIRVASTLPWPNRLLTSGQVQINDQPAPAELDDHVLVVQLPRPLPDNREVRLDVRLRDGKSFRQIFTPQAFDAFAGTISNLPPMLVRLRLEPGSFQGFEGRDVSVAAHQRSQPPRLVRTLAPQYTFLQLANQGTPARLQAALLPQTDLAGTPLVQFRYRAGAMARVSLQASGYGFIRFSEELPSALPVRLAEPPQPDGGWQTWIGIPADVISARPLRNGIVLQPAELLIGSWQGADQTGRYSTLDLDDIVAGPAVGPGIPLVFEPLYADPDGVSEVVYALAAGPQPWSARGDAAEGTVAWIAVTNGAVVRPELAALADGIHHLVVRARDPRQAWSAVSDVPFLIDRQPITVSSSLRAVPERYNGTCLDVRFDTTGGAYPRFDRLQVTCENEPLNLATDHGTVTYSPGGVYLELDWPWLLRKSVQRARDGQTLKVTFDGIADAAGNGGAAHTAAITLDYKADKRPPTLTPPAVGTNFLWCVPAVRQQQEIVSAVQNVTALVVTTNEFPVLELRSAGKNATMTHRFPQPWDPDRHPYLAISLRVTAVPREPQEGACALLLTPQHLPQEARRPENNAPFRLPLKPQAAGPQDAAVIGAIDWQPGRWNNLIIDVRALLKRETGLAEAPPVREFALAFPEDTGYAVQIRAAAVLMAWHPGHLLTFRAYDASGIAGVFWQGGGSEAMALRPARITLPAAEGGWMQVRVRDRAGNESDPYLVPIPPPPFAIPAGLPLAEPDPEDP